VSRRNVLPSLKSHLEKALISQRAYTNIEVEEEVFSSIIGIPPKVGYFNLLSWLFFSDHPKMWDWRYIIMKYLEIDPSYFI
jgi:hypothetical protein